MDELIMERGVIDWNVVDKGRRPIKEIFFQLKITNHILYYKVNANNKFSVVVRFFNSVIMSIDKNISIIYRTK